MLTPGGQLGLRSMAFPMLFLQPSLISSSRLQLTSISRRLCNHWWASPSSCYGALHASAIRWWWGASTWQSGGRSVQSAQGQQASIAQLCSAGQLSKAQMGLVSKGFFNGFLLSCLFLSSLNELDTARAAGFELGFSGRERQAEQQQQQQVEPTKGNCATCLGVVDETLGACGAVPNCVSTFDDRPAFFIAPWEFPGKLPTAFQQMQRILVEEGGIIAEQGNRYIHVVFTDKDGTIDDVEFLFSIPSIDATVNIRSASRRVSSNDYGRNQNRLERIRRALMWEEVPVLRNRSRKLFFLESPWDTFGPEPPPAFDYEDRLEFVPD